jgi:hypothetical protein
MPAIGDGRRSRGCLKRGPARGPLDGVVDLPEQFGAAGVVVVAGPEAINLVNYCSEWIAAYRAPRLNMADERPNPVPASHGRASALLVRPTAPTSTASTRRGEFRARGAQEGLAPTPWWVWGVSVVMLFAMGLYVGRYRGTFSRAHTNGSSLSPLAARCRAAGDERSCTPPSASLPPGWRRGRRRQVPRWRVSEWLAGDRVHPRADRLDGLTGPDSSEGQDHRERRCAFGSR